MVGPDGSLYLALREGNAIYRLDPATGRIEHLAGTGEKGYTGDGGPAREATLAGPKGLAYGPGGTLYIADTENHAIRAIDLATGIISTVLGTGERGDGPEPDPLACRLARPHGLWATSDGGLYVADSEAHRITTADVRIRMIRPSNQSHRAERTMARLPDLKREELDADSQAVWDRVAGSRGSVRGPFAILMHNPPLADRVAELGAQLRFRSSLTGAEKELAILTAGREVEAQYEWVAHEPLGTEGGHPPRGDRRAAAPAVDGRP